MIEKIRFLDTEYSGLDKMFPIGGKLDVNSNIVLLVGPNGSGKTGLVRMLASSIRYDRFFGENGISRSYDTNISEFGSALSSYVEEIGKAKKVEDGWYYFYDCDKIASDLERDPRFDVNRKRDLRQFDNESREYTHIVSNNGFTAISEHAFNQIKDIKRILSKDNDLNRWRYVKPFFEGGPLYIQEFSLPLDKETQRIHKNEQRSYTEFDPAFDGNIMVRKFFFPREIEESAARMMGKKVEYDPNATKRARSSPGQALIDSLDETFENIRKFFEENLNPRFNPNTHSIGERMAPWMHPRWSDEEVPEGSQLVVFMDEPTVYLDYRNRFRFKDRLEATIATYGDRLQFFIPTNDPILIERLGDARFINLYEQPAVSTTGFKIEL